MNDLTFLLDRLYGEILDVYNEQNCNRFLDGRKSPCKKEPPSGMDLVESEKDYSLVANVPGMTKDDISLELKDGMLTISCSKNAETSKGGDGKIIYRGRQSVSFKKSYYLSDKIDLDKIEASVENGVLSIRLPKMPEKMARKIEVK